MRVFSLFVYQQANILYHQKPKKSILIYCAGRQPNNFSKIPAYRQADRELVHCEKIRAGQLYPKAIYHILLLKIYRPIGR